MGANKPLKFTGERLISGMEGMIKLEHLHRYAIAIEYVENRIVLDVASGDGYGTNLLAKKAEKVWGLDIDNQSIHNAIKVYKTENLKFDIGSITKMPYPNNMFDVVVCFETIEHIIEYDQALTEMKRVLKKDGILLMSTPNKLIYTDMRATKNEFHVHEFYIDEYKNWLDSNFLYNSYLFQNPLIGSYIFTGENNPILNYTGSFDSINKTSLYDFKYIISISSNINKVKVNTSYFVESQINTFFEAYCKKSLSYRIGSLILSPLRFFKKWIHF